MRFALVSDAWKPQVNGVARTLGALCEGLTAAGHDVFPLTPDLFRTVPCPTDRQVRLAVGARPRLIRLLEALRPDAIHIATEGPLGVAARGYCVKRALHFTTAFHTRYPEYMKARFGVPLAWTYAVLRRFHGRSSAIMVPTETLRRELASRGFDHLALWTRGVDVTLFRPGCAPAVDLPRPVFLCVTRIAAEKSLPAFLDLDLPGSKLVVGDGHLLPEMKRRYPNVHFAGLQEGEALVRHYASADVFVLPSRTETFGLVLLEALACGLPVAALPVPGPLDVFAESGAGALDWDLAAAAMKALRIPRETCRSHAERFSWQTSVEQFVNHVVPVRESLGTRMFAPQIHYAEPV
ncbi:MAG: glycosyltransferase family 1 protein [Alphaproteobacteria bacterium]|nr:glycosyltransferase family 1 protein [Alphaproteobacteria bacterium]